MNTNLTKEELRKLRKQLGLTQEEMARKLGVTREWVGMLERGDRAISATIILSAHRLMNEHKFSMPEDSSSLVVAEDAATYGSTRTISGEIERHHKALMAAAGEDATRIGWIRQQQLSHLSIPPHWQKNSPASAEESEAEFKERVQRLKASMPEPVVPGINDDQTPPAEEGRAG